MIIGWRGPGWQVFNAHPGHVRQVRDWISAAITRHDCPIDPADAALVVSELFTNAVMHGPREGWVLVGHCLWSQGARIVVCDGGDSGEPELRLVMSQAENGRGLHVVDAISEQWGSFRLAGSLVVWCDLGQPLCVSSRDAWAWLHRVLSGGTSLPVPVRQDAEPGSGSADDGLLIPASVVKPNVTGRSAQQPVTRASLTAHVQVGPRCGHAWRSRFPRSCTAERSLISLTGSSAKEQPDDR